MGKVGAIKHAIHELSLEERAQLAVWFYQWEDDHWDRQMKQDAASGKLDKWLTEVDEEITRAVTFGSFLD